MIDRLLPALIVAVTGSAAAKLRREAAAVARPATGAPLAVTSRWIDGRWVEVQRWNRWVKPLKGQKAGPALSRIESLDRRAG